MRYVPLKPKNKLAEKLLNRLWELDYKYPRGGFHGHSEYCLGLHLCNYSEAVELGMNLGTGWGELDFVGFPDGRQMVIFVDAHVSLANEEVTEQ